MSYFTQEQNNSMPISNKAKLVKEIKRYIIRRINTNQDIVRLCRYLTKTPLIKYGETYNGECVNQIDLECGLLERLDDSRNKDGQYLYFPEIQSREEILIPYAFNDGLMTKEQLFIFVSNSSASFSEYASTGKYVFEVLITYAPTYNILEPLGEERSVEIMDKICEMFDSMFNDEESQENIGEVMFRIKSFNEVKVSTNGAMGRIIKISAEPLVDRKLINYAR